MEETDNKLPDKEETSASEWEMFFAELRKLGPAIVPLTEGNARNKVKGQMMNYT